MKSSPPLRTRSGGFGSFDGTILREGYKMEQPQREDPLIQELGTFLLPAGPITDSDLLQIETIIQEVLNKISENKKSTGQNKTDISPIISGIIVFKDWLSQQSCVDEVSIPYVQNSGEYSKSIFISYPGQVFANIIFNTGSEDTERYRLLIFVSAADGLKFASIIKDNTPLSS